MADDGDDLLIELGINENELIDDVEMSDGELDNELRTLDKEDGEIKPGRNNEDGEGEKIKSSLCKETENIIGKKDIETINNGKDLKVNKDFDIKHRHSKKHSERSYSAHDKQHNDQDDDFEKRRGHANFPSNIDKRRLYRPLEVTKGMDPMVVGREIAFRLHETKMNLIGHVVRVIGVSLSLEVFEETKKLMQKGGLKTDSGDRKRSPGGLFLYILKNRGYASDAQMKEIFKVENEKIKENKKRRAREQKIRKRRFDESKEAKTQLSNA